MSKVSITGNNSGTGTFTIAAPNSNNNRSFSLPDEDGVVLTDATDLEPQVKTVSNATGDAPIYSCRAWCNFDGTGTVSIRESGNVSSITDNGTGQYTVNFTTAMPDADYCVTGTTSGDNNVRARTLAVQGSTTMLTTSVRVTSGYNNTSLTDAEAASVAIFR